MYDVILSDFVGLHLYQFLGQNVTITMKVNGQDAIGILELNVCVNYASPNG